MGEGDEEEGKGGMSASYLVALLFSSSMHTYTRTQTHLVSPLPLTLDTGRRCAPGQDEKRHWQDG